VDGAASVLEALAASLPGVPRVHLREPITEGFTPVNLPNSAEMPEGSRIHPVAARLLLIGEIGRGGMGSVLKGRDADLGRDVAVKVLLEEHRGESELVQRFVEEAQIAGQLQHPGIVPVYELGAFADRRPYFSMKLVKGQTLSALLRQRQDAAEDRPRLLAVFAQVCQTLAYAHSRGVIHRDLKPSNVMVGAFGEVQVMDWGLAKVLSRDDEASRRRSPEDVSVIRPARGRDGSTGGSGSRTQAGSVLGTPAYMAPEQARGEVDLLDERADVFGLGAILCEILTGQPPFTGRSVEAQRKAEAAELDDAFARLDGCGAEVELAALARRCLAAKPEDRPRHAGAVAEAITNHEQSSRERLRRAELARAAEEARAVEAQATAVQERKAREEAQARVAAERRSRRLTLALASSGLLMILLGVGVWQWLRSEREAQKVQTNRSLSEALNAATALREQARTARGSEAASLAARAREQIQRAEALAEGGSADAGLAEQVRGLRAELDADEKDRELLSALETARLAQTATDVRESRFVSERAVPLFRGALRDYGMPVGEAEPESVAARLEQRPAAVREAVLAALDEWVTLAEHPALRMEEPHLDWLRGVLAAVEPEGWQRDVRTASAEKDPARRRTALEKLAATADVDHLPARGLSSLALRLMEAESERSAVALLRRGRAAHPGDFWLNHDLGKMLLTEQPSESVRYLTAAAALRPDSPGVHLNLGLALQSQGRSDDAIAEYRQALALDPKYATAQSNIGVALASKNRRDEAVAAFRDAVRLDPRDAMGHYNLGCVLSDQGKFDEAVAEYRQTLTLAPKYAEAHTNLGIALLHQGKRAEAVASFHKALAINPRLAEAHYNLGTVLAEQNNLDDAIARYRQTLAINPKSRLAYDALGRALKKQNKFDEALAALRQAIEVAPRYAPGHYNLGSMLYERGRLDEAVAAYRQAVALDPKYALGHYALGLALQGQRKLDEAIVAYRKAIELNPRYAPAHTNLGGILAATNRPNDAVTAFEKAIELDPKLAPPRGFLGLMLLRQGKLVEAREQLRRALELLPEENPQRRFVAEHLRQCEHQLDLEAKLPKVLAGEIKPSNATERLEYIQIGARKKLVAGVVRLYAEAFAAEPKLAGDLNAQHRYHAARSAVLASAGQGEDATKLGDKERSRLRTHARDWLHADLEAYGKLLESGKPDDRKLVGQRLQQWRQEKDFAAIREEDALRKLPADERQAFRMLWDEVEALRKKAQPEK
jgi:serine/threonine-protein kinase